MRVTDKQNLTAPNGACFFAKQRPDGSYEGERYVGYVENFAINISTERLEKYASNGGAREKVRDIVVRTDRTCSFSLSDISPENLQMFFGGDIIEDSGGGSVNSSTFYAVQPGRYYYLGSGPNDPIGVGSIEGSVEAEVNGDPVSGFDVDYKSGRVYILPDGDIQDGDEVEFTFTPTTKTRKIMTSGNSQVKGRLRIEGDNLEGENRDTIIPLMEVSPSGDFTPIADNEWIQLDFEGSILKPSGQTPAIIISGVVV